MKGYKILGIIRYVIGVSIMLNLSSSLFASEGKFNRASFRGLGGVYVSVESLEPEVENEGLTKDLIRKAVVSELHSAGINVLSRERWLDVTGSPYLYVNTHVLKLRNTNEYIYSINIALKQNVYPVRESIEIFGAVTWAPGGIIGITGDLEKIRSSLQSQVNKFIDVYLTENPK
jgi:hypothetical protein